MRYVKMLWKQDDPGYPATIFSEVDGEGWERRKVEIWFDGRKGYTDSEVESGGTGLGLEPWENADLEMLQTDPEFEVEYITKDQFKQVWAKRRDL